MSRKHRQNSPEKPAIAPIVSFKDIADSLVPFTGDDTYPIKCWIKEFEDIAKVMLWSDVEKLIYGKKLLQGTARVFLRTIGSVRSWNELCDELMYEFGPRDNAATIHKKLASRKKKKDETFQQYFLHMKELAMHGNIDDAALIEYVIDGIDDYETNKAILYGSLTLLEFRRKLDIYSGMMSKMQMKKTESKKEEMPIPLDFKKTSTVEPKPSQNRCYNCGLKGHRSPDCHHKEKGLKCFKCNEFGHISTKCTKEEERKTFIIEEEERKTFIIETDKTTAHHLDMTIHGKTTKAFIDTGSALCLMTMKEYQDLNLPHTLDSNSVWLYGLGCSKVHTKGSFTTKIKIEEYEFPVMFYVVDNEALKTPIVLGRVILAHVNLTFSVNEVRVYGISKVDIPIENVEDPGNDVRSMKPKNIIEKKTKDDDKERPEIYPNETKEDKSEKEEIKEEENKIILTTKMLKSECHDKSNKKEEILIEEEKIKYKKDEECFEIKKEMKEGIIRLENEEQYLKMKTKEDNGRGKEGFDMKGKEIKNRGKKEIKRYLKTRKKRVYKGQRIQFGRAELGARPYEKMKVRPRRTKFRKAVWTGNKFPPEF